MARAPRRIGSDGRVMMREDVNTKLRSIAALAALILFFAAAPAAAQTEASLAGDGGHTIIDDHVASMPMVRTARVSGGIALDGRLDDEAWSRVTPATGFVQTEPFDGAPASERTEVRFLYDDDALYIGARMHDAAGDVRQRLGRRDSYLSDSDWIYFYIDSYHDHQSVYQFSVNPAGVKRDAIGSGGFRDDSSWDVVWDVATSVDAEGWTAEIRIPFSQLRFSGADLQTWGIQISRRQISNEEVTVFSHTPKSMRGGPARYGHLLGLEGIRPGKRLEILPYVAARAEYVNVDPGDPFRSGSDWFSGTGLDMKYRLTSSVTLDATVNPDFGQVEVDPATINLSAFETSFDEKRPFFVEGADIFRFGETRMFYSRRIGRAPQGGVPDEAEYADRPDASTILGAAKLTGQTIGGWRMGALAAVTAEERAPWITEDAIDGSSIIEPRTLYGVARLQRTFRGGQSNVGGMMTTVRRDRIDGLDEMLRSSAVVGGIDFSHEFADRTWEVEGYLAGSRASGSPEALVRTQRSSSRYYQRPDAEYLAVDSSRTELTGYAGRLVLRKTAGLHWRGDVNLSATSPGLEINDLGFLTGVDRIGADVNITYVENEPGRTFRNWRINLRNSRDWNYGRDAVGGRSHLSFNGQFTNYWGGNIGITRNWASLDDRFTRGGPLAFNPAGYQVDFNLNSDSRLPFSGRINGEYGNDEGGGWSRRLSFNVSLRPADNWTLSAGPSVRQSHTEAQYVTSADAPSAIRTFGRRYIFAPLDQTTVSMETRLNVNFTPTVSLDVFAQPFIATGDYGEARSLRAARSFEFDPYAAEDTRDRDFVSRSLRGNAVLRWEWKPGSTLFLVWQQRRTGELGCTSLDEAAGDCRAGRFEFGRDARALFDSAPDNIFQIKMTYWLNI